MEFTGERVVPGQVDADLWNEHVARYAFAALVARRLHEQRPAGAVPAAGLRILDAGCGTGYGAAYLACADPSFHVAGVDNSVDALSYARAHYSAPNLDFQQSDCLALPFSSGEFDLAVAYEVIEHLPDPDAFLQELARVVAPGGHLLVSTPNRRYYSEERGYSNPFHTREYEAAEFDALLKKFFPERLLLGQSHGTALSFFPLAGSPARLAAGLGQAAFNTAPSSNDQPHFFVALAAPGRLVHVEPFAYVPEAGNVLREREQHIRRIEEAAGRELEERKSWAEALKADLEARDQTIRRLQAEHEEATAWGRGLDEQLAEARRILDERQRELEQSHDWAKSLDQERERLAGIITELQQELAAKIAWARTLEADVAAARAAHADVQHQFEERTEWALRLKAELEQTRAELRLLFASFWYRAGKRLRLSPVPASDRKPEGAS